MRGAEQMSGPAAQPIDDTHAGPSSDRILLVKTALDGHWRGVSVVARALRDAGFHVILGGMLTAVEIVRAAVDEDIDLLGLNVGGHVKVAERIVAEIRAVRPELPIFAGGIIAPWAAKRLQSIGVDVFPPGSSLSDIVAAARQLTGTLHQPTP
jgi:methylmalonyl-CoA mutase C-terminal domain/subunit